MKKYFCVETDEELQFGDVINLTLSKNIEDGKVTVEKQVEFDETTLEDLVNLGFVYEDEVEDDDTLDFGEPCKELAALEEDFEQLEDRVEKIEVVIGEIYDLVKSVVKEEEKTAQPKKK